MKTLPKYEVITDVKLYDIMGTVNEDEEREKLFNKQCEILESYGFSYLDMCGIHTFESAFTYHSYDTMSIDDAIESLAIKDGVDLVRFESGHIGFVAYYNDTKNGFEILEKI